MSALPAQPPAMTDDDLRAALAAQVEALAAHAEIERSHPRWYLEVDRSPGQLAFLRAHKKIRVAVPGNGWGKTTIAAMDTDMLIQKDDPFKPDVVPDHPSTVIWFTKKYQQFDIIKDQLERTVFTPGFVWNESKHRYVWPNGGRLYVASGDSDWRDLQGIEPDLVIFDEHPDLAQWREMQMRRRSHGGRKRSGKPSAKCRYVVAATMTEGETWFVINILKAWEAYHRERGLTNDEARHAQLHPDLWVWDTGGIADNPAMDAEDVEHYAAQAELSAMSTGELKVRTQGGYADFTAHGVFDTDALKWMEQYLCDGEVVDLSLVDLQELAMMERQRDWDIFNRVSSMPIADTDKWVRAVAVGLSDRLEAFQETRRPSRITIFEKPDPRATYVIGCDFAEGLEGKAYDTAIVCKRTGPESVEQVAEMEGHYGDVMAAWPIYLLGVYYFGAFIVGERQFGLPALRRLYNQHGYAYMYFNRDEVKRHRPVTDALGYARSGALVDVSLSNLRQAVRQRNVIVRSRVLHGQLKRTKFMPKNASDEWDEIMDRTKMKIGPPKGGVWDEVLGLNYCLIGARHADEFLPEELPYKPGTYGAELRPDLVLKGGGAKVYQPEPGQRIIRPAGGVAEREDVFR